MRSNGHFIAQDGLSLLILAGGRGERVGGQDKGLLIWQGRPLISAVHECYAPLADEVLISCNRNAERYADFGTPLADVLADYPGPLAGILRGLQAARYRQLLIVPCDNPQPPDGLYQRLASSHPQTPVRYAHDGERGQYLYALLERRPELLTNLQAYLEVGKRSVYGWYEQAQADAVDCRDMAAQFRNLNRADAFEAR